MLKLKKIKSPKTKKIVDITILDDGKELVEVRGDLTDEEVAELFPIKPDATVEVDKDNNVISDVELDEGDKQAFVELKDLLNSKPMTKTDFVKACVTFKKPTCQIILPTNVIGDRLFELEHKNELPERSRRGGRINGDKRTPE